MFGQMVKEKKKKKKIEMKNTFETNAGGNFANDIQMHSEFQMHRGEYVKKPFMVHSICRHGWDDK